MKKVTTRIVFGTEGVVVAALALSLASTVVTTVFGERPNGSDRNRHRRTVGTTRGISKAWDVPEAMT